MSISKSTKLNASFKDASWKTDYYQEKDGYWIGGIEVVYDGLSGYTSQTLDERIRKYVSDPAAITDVTVHNNTAIIDVETEYEDEMQDLMADIEDCFKYELFPEPTGKNASKTLNASRETSPISPEEEDAIKKIFRRNDVDIRDTRDGTDQDDDVTYREYIVASENTNAMHLGELMDDLRELEVNYGIGYWAEENESGFYAKDYHFFHYPEDEPSLNSAKSQVRAAVETHVEDQLNNAMQALMENQISAQTMAKEVADYDADWCTADYPSDIASRIDKATDELVKASVDLLMYDAPEELKSSKTLNASMTSFRAMELYNKHIQEILTAIDTAVIAAENELNQEDAATFKEELSGVLRDWVDTLLVSD